MSKLYLPQFKRFEQLFPQTFPTQKQAPLYQWAPNYTPVELQDRRLGKPPAPMFFGPYCMVRGVGDLRDRYFGSLWVRSAPEVIDFIKGNMLYIEHDHTHYGIIVRSPTEALVYVSYGQILGSRWLSYIDPSTIPMKKAA